MEKGVSLLAVFSISFCSRAVISSGRKRPLAQIQRVTSGSPQSCLASSPSFSSHCEKPIRFVFRKKFLIMKNPPVSLFSFP